MAQLILFLIVLGLIIQYWYVIAVAIGVVVLVMVAPWILEQIEVHQATRRRIAAERARTEAERRRVETARRWQAAIEDHRPLADRIPNGPDLRELWRSQFLDELPPELRAHILAIVAERDQPLGGSERA